MLLSLNIACVSSQEDGGNGSSPAIRGDLVENKQLGHNLGDIID